LQAPGFGLRLERHLQPEGSSLVRLHKCKGIMAKTKFDVVVEAVRYGPDGQVEWVRGYERRGATFTDLVIIPRQDLVERLKAGQVFVAGRRIAQMASTFEVSTPLILVHQNGRDLVVTQAGQQAKDDLAGVPIL
jgi:hypothetical protein